MNIERLLLALSSERPIFHSEADFQHALAWEIHKTHPNARIRLEVPSERIDKRERIDIRVEDHGQVCAIELKYKKTKVDLLYQGEKYNLRYDSAHDVSRYDFIKDLVRLESYIGNDPNYTGYAIMLTNENLYWEKSSRGVNSEEFFIHEGRVLGQNIEMKWHQNTGKGTSKGREKTHILKKEYSIHWKHYSMLPGLAKKNEFKYLLLKSVI